MNLDRFTFTYYRTDGNDKEAAQDYIERLADRMKDERKERELDALRDSTSCKTSTASLDSLLLSGSAADARPNPNP
jgi:hypothetical protein